jgi:histidyl-tRNA synthetase
MQNNQLPTAPYKGTSDFLPDELSERNYIFNKWRQVLSELNYQEYETSVLEMSEVFKIKSGEELGSTQIYSFLDKSNRQIALRPEQTPSLARLVSNNFGELKYPLRWFSIPNCFRYEQPQRGRRREFWQLNVDIIGSEEGWADFESIYLATKLMTAFGAKKQDYVVYYNHRGVLQSFLKEIGIGDESLKQVFHILDNWAKMGESENEAELSKIMDDKAKNQILCLLEGMNREMDLWDDIVEDEFPAFSELGDRLSSILGSTVDLQLNPALVRGLTYYTGMVFEVFDTDPVNNRSLFGGGRYDNLLDLYGKQASAVGFGMGQVPFTDFLHTHNLISKDDVATRPTTVLIPLTNEAVQKCYAEKIPELVSSGVAVEIDLDLSRALNKRRESAFKKGFEAVEIE